MMHKKSVFLATWLTITLIVTLLVPNPAWAQDGDGFSESFDDPRLEGWEHAPEVVVVDGVLRVSPGHFALRFGDWSEPTLDVRLKRTGPGEIVIHYHFRDESSYAVHILPDHVVLEKREAGTSTELGHAPLERVRVDAWMDLRVVMGGGQHEVFVNERSLFVASDPDPLPPGAILLQAHGEAIGEFDQVTVSVEPVPLPAREEPPPDIQPTATPLTAETAGGGSLFDTFFASQAGDSDLVTFLINIALAVVTSYILGRVYIHWGASLSNRRQFAANFILMTVTTTFIILVVRSSVALSLGLVGALSIVRFRTAIKEPEELAYLFFAIALGIGLGDNQRVITLLAFAITIALLGLAKLFRKAQADVNLHLTVASHNPGKVDMDAVMSTLKPHAAKLKLLRFDENDETLEMAFLVEFKHMSDLSQARAALRGLSDSVDVTFLDNKGIW